MKVANSICFARASVGGGKIVNGASAPAQLGSDRRLRDPSLTRSIAQPMSGDSVPAWLPDEQSRALRYLPVRDRRPRVGMGAAGQTKNPGARVQD